MIEVIAPAGKIAPAALIAIENYIISLGYQPRFGQYLSSTHPFLAGTRDQRYQDLLTALQAPDTDIIWCARGGSGCAELLPLLSEITALPHKKLLLGYSDITALLIFFRQQWGWTTWHAPVLNQLIDDKIAPSSQALTSQFIINRTLSYAIEDLVPLNHAAQQSTLIPAEITGGNLTVISHLAGTPYALLPQNKILLLEDINEQAYKIRRALTHLQQTGLFKNVAALLLGQFEPFGIDQQQTLQEFAQQQSIPVLQTQRIGHGFNNDILPFGEVVNLYLGSNSRLHIDYQS